MPIPDFSIHEHLEMVEHTLGAATEKEEVPGIAPGSGVPA